MNEELKAGKFNKDFSRWLHEAFDLRQRADYRDLVVVSAEQAQETLEHARAFVAGVKNRLPTLF